MRIIGIDPGLNVTGIGVVEIAGEDCRYVAHCVIRTKPSSAKTERLLMIRDGVREAARRWQVTAAAVEASFVGTNARSAMALGEARAAAILGLADAGLECNEYAPTLVKQTVAGYGRGEKAQIAEMVRLQLHLNAAPTPADASDALAIAITHWAHARLSSLR